MVTFDEVVDRITDAVRQVEADAGASPVLVAVVGEFQAKLAKATKHATGGLLDHDFVVELSRPAIVPRWRPRPTQGCRVVPGSRCSLLIWRSAS
jgi:hypothetical protein